MEVRRRKFIGHIMRKGYDNDCGTAMTWVPEGRPKWGIPPTTCRRRTEKERERAGWRSWSELSTTAAARAGWRQSAEDLFTTWREVVR